MKHGTSYKVLDDLREFLDPEIANVSMSSEYLRKMYNKEKHEQVTIDDILNPKQSWFSNEHCRRSLMFDSKK